MCPVLSSFSTCIKISTGPVLLCTGPKPLPFKGKGLGLVQRSTGPVEILTHVQYCQVFVYVSRSQQVQCSCALNPSRSPSKGNDWVQCTGALDLLRSWHVSSFGQFLYMYQNLNGSNAQEHWTRWDLYMCPILSSFCTRVKISTGPVLLCTGPKPLPFKGKGLGPVHWSTGPVEILTRIQFCPVFIHVSKSQRVQCSCALDPSRSASKRKDCVQCTGALNPLRFWHMY